MLFGLKMLALAGVCANAVNIITNSIATRLLSLTLRPQMKDISRKMILF